MKENGNIIITGTSSKTAQFATEENTTDIIVYELDASGNVLEEYVFDFNDNEEGKDIVYDRSNQGGFIVCGTSDAARSLAISDFTPNPKFTKDLLAVRYYVNGASADTNIFQIGYEGNDEFNSIIYYEPGNNFLVAGTVFLQGTRQSIIMNLQNELNTVFPVNGRDLAKTPGPASVSKIRQFGDVLFAMIGSYNSGRDNLFLQEVGADLNFVDSENPGVDIRKNGASRGYSFAYDNASDSYIIAGSTNESQGG